jgi:hypothetical protein
MPYTMIFSPAGMVTSDFEFTDRASAIFHQFRISKNSCSVPVGNWEIIYRVIIMALEHDEFDVTNLTVQYNYKDYPVDANGDIDIYNDGIKVLDEQENFLLRKFKMQEKLRNDGHKNASSLRGRNQEHI